jgi:hypothetical protein
MKYKWFIKCSKLVIIVGTISLILPITGCKKVDKTYYNYTNNLGVFKGNALEYLRAQPGVYDSMLLVINRISGIADTIKNANITIFAINNRSFSIALQNINQARQDSIPAMPPVSLSTLDSASLDTFFCRYLVVGRQLSESLVDFTDGLIFPSVRYGYKMQLQFTRTNASGFLKGGPKGIIFSDPKNSIFTKNWVRVNTVTVDIQTSNAIVNALDPSHDFGFGDDFIRHVNKR